jgi:uncharacterized damage-inducible protein DinB
MTQRKAPDMWVDPEHDPRVVDVPAVGEKAILLEYLDRYRTTIDLKCDGLDAEQLARRSVPPSTLSLLGLVRHLARVEHHWNRRVLEGDWALPRLYDTDDVPDNDFDGAVADDDLVIEAWEAWFRELTHSRKLFVDLDLDSHVLVQGMPIEVRDVVVHLLEEYARHAGHADLLREAIDGRKGQ